MFFTASLASTIVIIGMLIIVVLYVDICAFLDKMHLAIFGRRNLLVWMPILNVYYWYLIAFNDKKQVAAVFTLVYCCFTVIYPYVEANSEYARICSDSIYKTSLTICQSAPSADLIKFLSMTLLALGGATLLALIVSLVMIIRRYFKLKKQGIMTNLFNPDNSVFDENSPTQPVMAETTATAPQSIAETSFVTAQPIPEQTSYVPNQPTVQPQAPDTKLAPEQAIPSTPEQNPITSTPEPSAASLTSPVDNSINTGDQPNV